MLLKTLIYKGMETISDLYPEREAREMVFAYLEDTAGVKRHTHILEPECSIADEKAAEIMAGFERMASGEPLQYVLGKAHFYGRTFHVTPATLIPRPETELLCRDVVEQASVKGGKTPRILDLCTGSGCIAWTLALEMPGARVTAVDVSQDALEVAQSQDFAEELSVVGALAPKFILNDILESPAGQLEKYDIIVSNPPYVMDKEKALMRSNVLDHEPHLALFVSDDDPLVFYRAIVSWAQMFLKPDGYGIVEINEALGPQTADLFRTAGFRDVRIIRDLSDRDRFVSFYR